MDQLNRKISSQSSCLFLFRLCVAALSVNSFCGSREALYGVFDGDRNVEVPYLLQCTMNDVLAEELHKTKSEEDYMTNTFLVMQRYVFQAFLFYLFLLRNTITYMQVHPLLSIRVSLSRQEYRGD